jgi:hypothetical protein
MRSGFSAPRLGPSIIQSVFPHLPTYLSFEPVSERTSSAATLEILPAENPIMNKIEVIATGDHLQDFADLVERY